MWCAVQWLPGQVSYGIDRRAERDADARGLAGQKGKMRMLAKWLSCFRGLSGAEREDILIAILGSFLVAAPWLYEIYDLYHRTSHVAPHLLLSPMLFLFGAVVCILFYWTVGASLEIAFSCLGLSFIGMIVAMICGPKVLYGLVPVGLWDCWFLVYLWRQNRESLEE